MHHQMLKKQKTSMNQKTGIHVHPSQNTAELHQYGYRYYYYYISFSGKIGF